MISRTGTESDPEIGPEMTETRINRRNGDTEDGKS